MTKTKARKFNNNISREIKTLKKVYIEYIADNNSHILTPKLCSDSFFKCNVYQEYPI